MLREPWSFSFGARRSSGVDVDDDGQRDGGGFKPDTAPVDAEAAASAAHRRYGE